MAQLDDTRSQDRDIPEVAATPRRGADVLALNAQSATWIRRRVDNFYFIDDRTVRSEIELHVDLTAYVDSVFTKPDVDLDLGAGANAPVTRRQVIPVPLLELERSAHTAFKVTDAGDTSVAFAARPEERSFICQGLQRQLEPPRDLRARRQITWTFQRPDDAAHCVVETQ